MLLIMPTSLNQAGQKRRQLRDGKVKDAMLKCAPDTSFGPRQFLIGAGLAAVWIAIRLVALLA